MRTIRPCLGKFAHIPLEGCTEIACTNRGTTNDSSSLSDEFYQVMVGDPRMSIHGWKQLAEWSIEHSCLSDDEIEQAKRIHAKDWDRFCRWIVETYGAEVDGADQR